MIAAPKPFAPRRISNLRFAVIGSMRELPVASCPPAERVTVVESVTGGGGFGASSAGLGAATSAASSAGGGPSGGGSANARAGTKGIETRKSAERMTGGRIRRHPYTVAAPFGHRNYATYR